MDKINNYREFIKSINPAKPPIFYIKEDSFKKFVVK